MRSEQLTHRRLTVPFFDLEPSHAGIRGAIARDIEQLIAYGTFTNGPPGRRVRAGVRRVLRRRRTASGSRAGSTLCGSRSSPQGSSRETKSIVPAGTFVATLEAVTQAGGTPVLVDVGEDD